VLTSASDVVLDGIDQSVRLSKEDLRGMVARADEVASALTDSGLHIKCQLVGSITRSTALTGYSDVDLIAITDLQGSPKKSPQRAIADLAIILLAADFIVETDEFAASVKFDWPPAVDVMPAIRRNAGAGYLIPAGRDAAWQEFFPDRLKELTAESVRKLGPRFGVIVRLSKLWNITRSAGFKSSDLEELASIALGGRNRMSTYSQDLISVLTFGYAWAGGNPSAISKMRRPFPSVGRESRSLQIIQGSLAAAHALQDADDEVKARRLTEELFGDKITKFIP
jgi:hypothetical protein